ncbi:MAG: putative dTDP-glucose 4,6-dehydratase [Devosia sp.]|nr:putative dTDP-glucose 4,6-dehydratase [Devosia sp.]
MRILVTGGAGFIGSAVVRHLVLLKGYEVLNIDKLTYAGTLGSLRAVAQHPRHRLLKADIADGAAMAQAFERFRPERVMHLAAETHVDRSINGAAEFLHTNVVGSFALLEAARVFWAGLAEPEQARFRFLQVSTDEVYGSLGAQGLFDETTPYDPSSPYSASKAAADHLARAWHRTYGLPVVVANCSNNYGPFQFPEKLVPLTILKALEGSPLPLYGRGEHVRDWLHVEDHARALDLIAERGRPGQTYNVGARNERRNLEVVEGICALLDALRPQGAPHNQLIRFVEDRPGHDARYGVDASKLQTELGWRAEESFETGLEKTVRWYLDNQWWWRPLQQRYAGQRLGVLPGGKA